MKKTKFTSIFLTLLLLSSCSQLLINPVQNDLERYPAGTPSEDCKSLVNKILAKDNQSADATKPWEASAKKDSSETLIRKNNHLTAQDKIFVLNLPPVDWFNSVRKSLISHFKTRNKSRYPIFYLDKNSDYQKIGKGIPELLEKQVGGNLSEEEGKLFTRILSDIDSFTNYQKDIEAIINERASLQWNIEYLKRLGKTLEDEPIDIALITKKASGNVKIVHTIRRKDNNLPLVIDEYRKKLIDFNGRAFKPGILEKRILKQALLKDIVTIYQREVEFTFKNTGSPSEELTKLYYALTNALKSSDFDPSTYGVFKIDNKVFKAEMLKLTGADDEVAKSQINKEKISGVWRSFYMNKNVSDDPETMSTMKKAYLTVLNLTTLDFTNLNLVQVGVLGVVAVSAYNYFAVNPSTTAIPGTSGEVTATSASGSSVQEIQDPQLNNTIKKQESFISEQYRIVQQFINKELFSK